MPRRFPRHTLMSVVDFTERIAATAAEAGLAVYLLSDSHTVDTVRVALGAAGFAALKFGYKKLVQWQVAHPE